MQFNPLQSWELHQPFWVGEGWWGALPGIRRPGLATVGTRPEQVAGLLRPHFLHSPEDAASLMFDMRGKHVCDSDQVSLVGAWEMRSILPLCGEVSIPGPLWAWWEGALSKMPRPSPPRAFPSPNDNSSPSALQLGLVALQSLWARSWCELGMESAIDYY